MEASPADLHVECAEDLASIEAIAEPLAELAARALEPNVFFEPPFLIPAFRHLAPAGGTGLLGVWRTGGGTRRLVGALPIACKKRTKSLPIGIFGTWDHPYSFLGTPLLDPDGAESTLRAILSWSRRGGLPGRVLRLDRVNADGEFMRILRAILQDLRLSPRIDRQLSRPVLRRHSSAEAYLRENLSYNRRSRIRRNRNRFEKEGELSFPDRGGTEGIEAAAGEFLDLEASGWKGRAGTALAARPDHRDFFIEMVKGFAERGRLLFDSLSLGRTPVAMRIAMVSGDAAFCFKAAYAERYAKYSPGLLLEEEHVRLFHHRSHLSWMDSCASGTTSPTYTIWRDRREVQTLLIPIGDPLGSLFLGMLPALKWVKRIVKRKQDAESPPLPTRGDPPSGGAR